MERKLNSPQQVGFKSIDAPKSCLYQVSLFQISPTSLQPRQKNNSQALNMTDHMLMLPDNCPLIELWTIAVLSEQHR